MSRLRAAGAELQFVPALDALVMCPEAQACGMHFSEISRTEAKFATGPIHEKEDVMKRQVIGSLALALAVGFASPAAAGTAFGFQIGIAGAPPPPRVVYDVQPRMVFVPEANVYMVQSPDASCDEFNVGPYWYMCSGDYWYRSTSYGGPFFAIDVRSVPSRIFTVEPDRWNAYPVRLERWHRDYDRNWDGNWDGNWNRNWDRGRDRGWDRDWDRGPGRHGHGHAWGHDKDRGRGRDDDQGEDHDHGWYRDGS